MKRRLYPTEISIWEILKRLMLQWKALLLFCIFMAASIGIIAKYVWEPAAYHEAYIKAYKDYSFTENERKEIDGALTIQRAIDDLTYEMGKSYLLNQTTENYQTWMITVSVPNDDVDYALNLYEILSEYYARQSVNAKLADVNESKVQSYLDQYTLISRVDDQTVSISFLVNNASEEQAVTGIHESYEEAKHLLEQRYNCAVEELSDELTTTNYIEVLQSTTYSKLSEYNVNLSVAMSGFSEAQNDQFAMDSGRKTVSFTFATHSLSTYLIFGFVLGFIIYLLAFSIIAVVGDKYMYENELEEQGVLNLGNVYSDRLESAISSFFVKDKWLYRKLFAHIDEKEQICISANAIASRFAPDGFLQVSYNSKQPYSALVVEELEHELQQKNVNLNRIEGVTVLDQGNPVLYICDRRTKTNGNWKNIENLKRQGANVIGYLYVD